LPRITLEEVAVQITDEILEMCVECEFKKSGECKNPYYSRKEVIREALTKFLEQDCTPDKED